MTDGTLELTLPLAPSTNTYWRHVGHKVLLSANGRKYRADGIATIWQAIGRPKPMKGRIALHIVVHPRDKREIDLDNRLKALLDLLTHAEVYGDDSQVDKMTVVRGEIVKGGLMQVQVREIG